MIFANSRQRNNYGLILIGLLTLLFILPSMAEAQAPVITCPGPVELTLDDIGTVCIELPITGADNVDAGTGTWNNNDTLCISITMPVTQTFRVIASNVDGADTCDVVVSFPGVTTKSGTIDAELWTSSNSPYCIVGDCRVGLLDIDPGVEVLFFGNFELEVINRITAFGNIGNSIRFITYPGSVGWKRIYFNVSAGASDFAYCQFMGSTSRAISVNKSAVNITRCSFLNNSGGGIYSNSNIDLSNCDFINNDINSSNSTYGGGAFIQASAVITNCRFIDNDINSYSEVADRNSYGGGLYVAGKATVLNCTFEDNSTYSFACCNIGSPYGYRYSRSKGGAMFLSGDAQVTNCIVQYNSSVAESWGYHGVTVRGASGIHIETGNVEVSNCTIVDNVYAGIQRAGGIVSVLNSIFWGNGSTQTVGAMVIEYSCIQGADTTGGNPDSIIIQNPNFYSSDSLTLLSGSPCIDAGNPDPIYNDCENLTNLGNPIPPARGTLRNDIGAYGGPGLCGLSDTVRILCPQTQSVNLCELNTEICLTLPIYNSDSVWLSEGTWSGNQFCFIPQNWGDNSIGIIASNSITSDNCNLLFEVNQDVPLHLNTSQVIFAITETQTNMPTPKYLQVTSSCADGISNWHANVFSDGDWLQIDKSSGTNPDSILLGIDSTKSYSAGVYGAVVAFRDAASGDILASSNVTLFVAPGTDVGTVASKPGNVIAIPISINTDNDNPNDSVKGFTIPLKYHSFQLDLIRADSVVFDGPLFDNMNLIFDKLNGVIIVDRPTQDPPLPDSTYLAKIFFTIDSSAADELVLIDTTTYSDGINTYEYQFVQSTGDTTIPSFSPGAIVIGYEPEPIKITAPSGTYPLDSIPMTKCVPLQIENAAIVVIEGTDPIGAPLTGVTWENGTLCFNAVEFGAHSFTVTADNGFYKVQVVFGFDTHNGITSRADGTLPQIYEMHQNYPNPFNPSTNIDFSLPKASQVTLEVYNITGQKVITLIDQRLAAGFYTVDWDSKSSNGKPLASGVYFYRLKAGDFLETKKMLLLK